MTRRRVERMIHADEFVAFVYVHECTYTNAWWVLLIESERVESSRRRRTLPKKKSAPSERVRANETPLRRESL